MSDDTRKTSSAPREIRYKVVELSEVTDESIEETLNEYSSQGYRFDAMHFAMRESSRRPSMAFLIFVGPELN